MLKVPHGYNEIVQIFGDIEKYIKDDGVISSNEMKQFLTTITLPFPIKYAYSNIVVNKITCHKLLSDTFVAVFEEIQKQSLKSQIFEYGGCYNYRSKRTSSKLSTHSWGIAIDLNPKTNALGTIGDMNHDVIAIFKDFGFFWGGNFSRIPDPMHFQYAEGY